MAMPRRTGWVGVLDNTGEQVLCDGNDVLTINCD